MPAFEDFITDQYFKEFSGNKYLLVNVAAFRARMLNDGVESYVRSRSKHPLQVALEEISQGFIKYTLGAEVEEIIEATAEEDFFRYDEIFDLEGEADFEDEEALDFEEGDFEEEAAAEPEPEHEGFEEVEEFQ